MKETNTKTEVKTGGVNIFAKPKPKLSASAAASHRSDPGSAIDDPDLELEDLELGDPEEPLTVALFGPEGSGKTRFCATAPDPIGVVPLDRKTRFTMIKTAKEYGKKIIMPKADLIRTANPLKLALLEPYCDPPKNEPVIIKLGQSDPPMCCAIHYYRWHVNRIKAVAFQMAEREDIRTIVIDSGTQLWEDILFANYGRNQRIMPRDRGSANQEMIDLLNSISSKNVIITHKAGDVWEGEGQNAKKTGDIKLEGFSKIGYHANVVVEMRRVKGENSFYMSIQQCQANPELNGKAGRKILEDEAITFVGLAVKVYPDTEEPEKWM